MDSAVTATVLTQAGADVVGVFIKGWYPPGLACTWAEDRRDAMRVAAHLGIPFHTLDASADYKRFVIDYLVNEYRAGRTPNPDIMCNREVKFGAFYRFAKEHGAHLIATGHYARVEEGRLYRGADESKDQSYFLWAVPKEALSMTLFPLGSYQKSDVRALAKSFNLPVAEKRDSQGICFLGNISMDEFLRNEFGTSPGDALLHDGTKVGTHDGALLHTIGERAPIDGEPGPWYVVAKDIAKNTLTVSHERATASTSPTITLREESKLGSWEGELAAQYRYHGPVVSGTCDAASNTFTPSESLPEPIASGQSLVMYRNDECLGGGIIV